MEIKTIQVQVDGQTIRAYCNWSEKQMMKLNDVKIIIAGRIIYAGVLREIS
jgi:hypothetical protein